MENKRIAYPRPELVRDNWMNLNGEWGFEFDFGNICRVVPNFGEQNKNFSSQGMFEKEFTKVINVPFCPESKLSGIEYKDFINACWYKKEVNIPTEWKGRILLNFEASYYETAVFVNNQYVGYHDGGYTPFSFDITDFVKDNKATILVHCAGDSRDFTQASGKQSTKKESYGCFYTRSTGIYETVWLECVNDTYLTKYFGKADIDNSKYDVELFFNKLGKKEVTLNAFFDNQLVGCTTLSTSNDSLCASLKLTDLYLWDLENPHLYDLEITVKTSAGVDTVKAYFGMRQLEVDKYGLILNHERLFQRLVLDQGYYPEGVYTAPTDDSFKKDIELSMKVGFNGARLHQKTFERRFLYEADKLGYIVWGEFPSWNFDYTTTEYFNIYLKEWNEIMERDFNHPAIVTWCPMNENFQMFGKSQSNAFVRDLYLATKKLDNTRPCVDVSSMYHVLGDFFDTHDYVQEIDKFNEAYGTFKEGEAHDIWGQKYNGKPFILSEYGGFKWPVSNEGWGYGDGPKTEEEFVERFNRFNEILLGNEKICGLCYTQFVDVEQEQNGVYYYDRSAKFSDEILKKFKDQLKVKAAYEKLPIE